MEYRHKITLERMREHLVRADSELEAAQHFFSLHVHHQPSGWSWGDVRASLLVYSLASAAATWVVVAMLAVATHGQLTRQPPLRKQVA